MQEKREDKAEAPHSFRVGWEDILKKLMFKLGPKRGVGYGKEKRRAECSRANCIDKVLEARKMTLIVTVVDVDKRWKGCKCREVSVKKVDFILRAIGRI